jgi:hypothetical protein
MSNKPLGRVLPHTDNSRLLVMFDTINSMPQGPEHALVVLPGMGEDIRIRHAIARWQSSINFKYLLVAGINLKEKTARDLSLKSLSKKPFNLKKTKGVLTQVKAANTLEQAVWIAEQVKELQLDTLTITAPFYHLPRAYLTLMASCEKLRLQFPLIPEPTPMSRLSIVPEEKVLAVDMVPGEISRILKYQKSGDVASYELFLEYYKWLSNGQMLYDVNSVNK